MSVKVGNHYKYRFCRNCLFAVNTLLSEEGRQAVFALVRFGRYECPFHKEHCGKVIQKPNVAVIDGQADWIN